jgi:hypothetical protein
LLKVIIYFLMAYLIESLSYRKDISLRAFMETYRILGTVDEQTFMILLTHLSTYLSPKGLKLIYFKE